jgi:CelD/BcsL family acetyltransferase involved in cellulose biosynthesis/glycosyltransferase involved in cell wall biosynthesis
VARAGSQVTGELEPVSHHTEPLDGAAIGRVHAEVQSAIAKRVASDPIDVVHMHGIDFDRYLPALGVPLLVTLHLPPSWYSRQALAPTRPSTHLCCVSQAQRATLPHWAAAAELVENGILVESFGAWGKRHRGDFCLMLARICPEKGIHDALAAARRAGTALWLAGELSAFGAHQRYFDREVRPHLDGVHRYLGPVKGQRKRELLASARALLVPSRVPETSSLVAMEAIASGTPVLAYASGALPTIVEHAVTGFIVDGVDAMAEAIGRVGNLDSQRCQAQAMERFSAKSMTTKYLTLYEQLASTEACPSFHPNSLKLERVRGAVQLAQLRQDWSALWDADPHATPFQRPEWLLAYARVFCADSDAQAGALVARHGAKMVGLLPLCERNAGVRTSITLLGTGVSDHLDLISEPGYALECSRRFLEALAESASGSSIELSELREASPLNTVTAPKSSQDRRFVQSPYPVLQLMAGVNGVPESMQAKLRYYARRAERLGKLDIEETTDQNVSRIAEQLEILFALHKRRWEERNQNGVLSTAQVRTFMHDAVGALARAGRAKVLVLHIDARPAAAMLLLHDASSAYYYIGGFEPALRDVSPGTLLIAHAINSARHAGFAEFDFLRGNEAYKYRFGARDRFNHARHLVVEERDGIDAPLSLAV